MSAGIRRTLAALAVAELLTLGVLLANLATLHLRPVTQMIGPTHGAVYLAIVAIVWISPGIRVRHRVLGSLPVVGGPIVAWLTRRAAGAPATRAGDPPSRSRRS